MSALADLAAHDALSQQLAGEAEALDAEKDSVRASLRHRVVFGEFMADTGLNSDTLISLSDEILWCIYNRVPIGPELLLKVQAALEPCVDEWVEQTAAENLERKRDCDDDGEQP